jgi:carnitine monooxygenase subunit
VNNHTDIGAAAVGCESDSSDLSTLPREWYTDLQIYSLEEHRIFERNWHYFCHVDRLSQPGDYLSRQIGRVPVTMVRTPQGHLKGYVNVCRHRFHELLGSQGNCKAIRCPYHSWTYDLNGKLLRIPDNPPGGINPANISLLSVSVGQWGPLVFVKPSTDGGVDLQELLGDLPARVEGQGLTLEGPSFNARRTFELQCNWKVYVENAVECYHCQANHPAFSRLIDVRANAYLLEVSKWYTCQRSERLHGTGTAGDDDRLSPDPRGADDPAVQYQFYWLWPTTFVGTVTGPGSFAVHFVEPLSVNRSRLTVEYFFASVVSHEDALKAIDANTATLEEDRSLVESAQRGLQSGAIPHGHLVLPREELVLHFQNLVREALS